MFQEAQVQGGAGGGVESNWESKDPPTANCLWGLEPVSGASRSPARISKTPEDRMELILQCRVGDVDLFFCFVLRKNGISSYLVTTRGQKQLLLWLLFRDSKRRDKR